MLAMMLSLNRFFWMISAGPGSTFLRPCLMALGASKVWWPSLLSLDLARSARTAKCQSCGRVETRLSDECWDKRVNLVEGVRKTQETGYLESANFKRGAKSLSLIPSLSD